MDKLTGKMSNLTVRDNTSRLFLRSVGKTHTFANETPVIDIFRGGFSNTIQYDVSRIPSRSNVLALAQDQDLWCAENKVPIIHSAHVPQPKVRLGCVDGTGDSGDVGESPKSNH